MTKEELIKKWEQRDLSWSQISSFEYSPEDWYKSYFLGIKSPPSAEMLFGSKVGKQLETDPTFLPMIQRRSTMEYEFKAVHKRKGKRDIKCVGYADSFGEHTEDYYTHALEEYKSGVKAWDQKRVDNHGQITFYCYMKYLTDRTEPDTIMCTLWWMPTKKTEHGDFTTTIEFVPDIENKIKKFSTKRTRRDLIEFGMRIDKTLDLMMEYILAHP